MSKSYVFAYILSPLYYNHEIVYNVILQVLSFSCLFSSHHIHYFIKIHFQAQDFFLLVKKDPSSLQYITQIHQRTPLVPVKLALNLAGESLWVDRDNGYKSSTYNAIRCLTGECSFAWSTICGICQENNTEACCRNVVSNPVTSALGDVAEDVLSIQTINESIPGPVATVPNFIFSSPIESNFTQNLGKNVKGMVGFGQQQPASFVDQLASIFKFSRRFAICLSSSTKRNGIIFIGHSPYFLSLSFDASRDLIYTPIITYQRLVPYYYPHPISFMRPSPEYYVQVSSIRINGKTLPLNKALLSLDENEKGGTKISTSDPYTVLEPSIYDAVSTAFINEMTKEVKIVPAVPPFKTCFDSKYIGKSRLGYNAPEINLVFHKPNVYWTIIGANSLVKVKNGVICLAFVERREATGQAIVVGGYQIQDNLVDFDTSRSRIGFSNSLYFHQTTCANHNYA